MLDVLKIIVGNWHTQLNKLLLNLVHGILQLILDKLISLLELFLKSELSHLVVDLSQLLHLEVMLSNNMLFLLRDISQVPGGRSSINLTRWHSLTIG